MGRRVADLTFIDQSGAPVSGPPLDRPIRISIKYDERDVAEAVSQESLGIEKYRAEDEQWDEMQATIDQKSRRMTTWEKDFNPNRAKLKGKVLIAHREDDEGDSLNDAMEAIGFEILPESDGLVVSRLVASERPDVVLLDLAMPRLDGIQVLRQIKGDSMTRATSVIVLAESEDRNLQSSLMTMGVRELILKPWHPGDIQRRVKRAYETSRAKQRQMKRAVDRFRARQARKGPGAAGGAARSARGGKQTAARADGKATRPTAKSARRDRGEAA